MSEIIKRQNQPDSNDRKVRGLTAGLSAVGAAAGVGGLAYAAHDAVKTRKYAQMPSVKLPRVPTKIGWKTKALIPLEVAGLGGELMATHILHGDAKKPVAKADSSLSLCLQTLLSDVVEMYFQAHLAHWNVTGPSFAAMHEFFGDIYTDVYESIDPIAENMRKIGVMIPASVLEARKVTTNGSDPMALASGLLATNTRVLKDLVTAFDCADGHDGLQNFIAERIDMHEKWAWQLRSTVGLSEVKETPMSKSMFDPRNGAGRRIVETYAVSTDDIDKGWNPMAGIRLASRAASGSHVMDSTRTERAIADNRTLRRFQESKANASQPSFEEKKAARAQSNIDFGRGPNASTMTPNGRTIGQRQAALAASRANRAAGNSVGASLAQSDQTANAAIKQGAHDSRMAAFRGMSLPQKIGSAAKESWKNATPTAKLAVGGTGVAAGGAALVATGRKKNDSANYGGYETYGKARYFDPEADRQRRSGLYSGVLAGGAVSTGTLAGLKGNFERVTEDAAKVKGRSIPKLHGIKGSRAGYAAAGASGLLALGAAGTYKRGIDRRNQPWT